MTSSTSGVRRSRRRGVARSLPGGGRNTSTNWGDPPEGGGASTGLGGVLGSVEWSFCGEVDRVESQPGWAANGGLPGVKPRVMLERRNSGRGVKGLLDGLYSGLSLTPSTGSGTSELSGTGVFGGVFRA
jgi:hypothetical protein